MHIELKKTVRTSLNNVIFYIDKKNQCAWILEQITKSTKMKISRSNFKVFTMVLLRYLPITYITYTHPYSKLHNTWFF